MSQETPIIEPIDAWSSPLFVTTNPDHEFLKESLLEYVYNYHSQQGQSIASEVAIGAKHQLFESKLCFLEAVDPAIMELRRMLEELIAAVASEVNQSYWPEGAEADANIIESWYHITRNGGYHDIHSHPNCSWCGIYYLDPGECDLGARNGVNRFYDPRINAEHYADPGTAYLSNQGFWDFEPVEGQIVIFPSYLKHSALPYFGDKDRVVIAFNSVVELV
ncbi:putative 2OG-Fe(II) oxygenase [Marinobacterium jannaschii]|uniref:putative 2OG-Fe(II) oxygenase n=1 Tax=Marinobacterium jannaschii TaxID=64970 RepID=UPI0004825B2A|nr:putative 2OG-Fe(II) oxygenase [Marinobacterium jannaschii]